MDTAAIAKQAVEALELKYQVDPLDGVIGFVLGHAVEGRTVRALVQIQPERHRLAIVAHNVGDTGGKNGTFEPALAALVAHLAYHTRLALGMDERDGEIEAWQAIDLPGVPEETARLVAERELRHFLQQLTMVVANIGAWQAAAAEAATAPALSGLRELTPCD